MTSLVGRGYGSVQSAADRMDNALTFTMKGSDFTQTAKGIWNGFYRYVRAYPVAFLVTCGRTSCAPIPMALIIASLAFPPRAIGGKELGTKVVPPQRFAMGLLVTSIACRVFFPGSALVPYIATAAVITVLVVSVIINVACVARVNQDGLKDSESVTVGFLGVIGLFHGIPALLNVASRILG